MKEIFGSQALRVSWNGETASFLITTKLSSTYRFQILGGTDEVLIAKSSITSIQRLATIGIFFLIMQHKISTASTLLFRASNLPSSLEGKTRETNHVRAALEANGYPSAVISNILNKKPPPSTVPPPEELVSMFFKWVDPSSTYQGFACLPYISGLTEPLTRLLRKNDIRVVNKPLKTLQQEFPSPKFRQPSDLQCNVVYKIPCKDCSWNYIGETGRCFQTRKKEHKRNLKNFSSGSNVANHAWKNNHCIDFDNACVIDKGDYRVRKTLESWHTAKTVDADNNSKPLPRQYSILP